MLKIRITPTLPAWAALAPALLAFVLLHLALSQTTLAADEDHDQDDARRAVAEGRSLPLTDILTRAERLHPGQMLEAELESMGGRMVYELKFLSADGRVFKAYYDARTGAPLRATPRSPR